MTHSVQPRSWVIKKEAEKKIKGKAEESYTQSRDYLAFLSAVFDSLNGLYEKIIKLNNSLEKKLAEKQGGGEEILESISRLSEITTSLNREALDMASSVKTLVRETDKLIKTNGQTAKGMGRVGKILKK
jgi:Mg2+ and Co2+ transporter CorA